MLSGLFASAPSDDEWGEYVAAQVPGKGSEATKTLLRDQGLDEGLIAVLHSYFGDYAPKWLDYPCDAMGGLEPRKVFESGPRGVQILRSALMSLP